MCSALAASEAFVLPSTSNTPSTQLSATSRAEFLRDVAATSLASVIIIPGAASADDAEDLSMPTADEQKAIDVSEPTATATCHSPLTLDSTSLYRI